MFTSCFIFYSTLREYHLGDENKVDVMNRHIVCMGEARSAHKTVIGNLNVRVYLRHTNVYWRIILKLSMKKWNVRMGTAFSRLRTESCNQFLWTRNENFRFQKAWNRRLLECLPASQKEFCSMELVVVCVLLFELQLIGMQGKLLLLFYGSTAFCWALAVFADSWSYTQ
jgi:hypothetical protein